MNFFRQGSGSHCSSPSLLWGEWHLSTGTGATTREKEKGTWNFPHMFCLSGGMSPFYRWQLQRSKKSSVFPVVTQLGDGKIKVESKALCDTENQEHCTWVSLYLYRRQQNPAITALFNWVQNVALRYLWCAKLFWALGSPRWTWHDLSPREFYCFLFKQ